MIGDLLNATDTRFAAAEALARLNDPAHAEAAQSLAVGTLKCPCANRPGFSEKAGFCDSVKSV